MSRAFQITDKGKHQIAEVPIPTPKPNEVIVETEAIALNPIDQFQYDLGMFVTTYPMVQGFDFAGVVSDVGSDVKNFKKGDRVVGIGAFGGFATHVAVTANHVSKIPDNVSFEGACTLPLTILTSGIALHANYGLPEEGDYSGKTMLVWGAASSVGAFGVQLAKILKFKVIATASPHNFEYVKSIGADVVFDYNDEDVVNKIRKETNNSLQHVYSAIMDAKVFEKCVASLKDESGTIVTVVPHANMLPPNTDKVTFIPTNGWDGWDPSKTAAYNYVDSLFSKLEAYLRDGKIKPNPVQIVPNGLAGIPDGYALLREKKVSGKKLVLKVKDTPK